MKERIDIEELRAGTDVEIGAVGRQVGLGLVGPQRVESLAENVVADGLPVPLGRLGVGGVDVGAGAVIGQSVDRRAVGQVNEPAFPEQLVVVAVPAQSAARR